ncbi:MAG: protein phosphatase 2C domain-containing protein [Alloprevotella sp.]
MDIFISPGRCTTAVDSRIGGRAENQDCATAPDTPYGTLVVVCDGMGGGKAGASASTTTVQAMVQYVRQARPGQPAEQVLTQAVMHAHGLLRQTVCQHPELLGMGTTCVAALLTSTQAAIVHVGDSRCYLMRAGSVVFRTADHSVVGEMVRKGELTDDDARRAANANVITRALGIADRLEPEANLVDLCPGDRLALCTDGLWNAYPEAELQQLLAAPQPVDALLPAVMDGAEQRAVLQGDEHYDNLTLALVQLEGTAAAPVQQDAAPSQQSAELSQQDAELSRQRADVDFFDEAAPTPVPEAGQPAVPPKQPAQPPRKPSGRRRGLFIVLAAVVLALSIAALCYYFVSRPVPQTAPPPVPKVAKQTTRKPQPKAKKDTARYVRQVQNVIESQKPEHDRTQRISQLVSLVEQLRTGPSERNVDEVIKAKKETLAQLLKNYSLFVEKYNVPGHMAGYIDERKNKLIETQRDDGASTRASVAAIDEVLAILQQL